jgi:radical SAM superfamily enzyme YgiQ (UPF0313 family)
VKILLVNPPKNPQALAPDAMEPLALEVLAATIAEHDARILDLRFESEGTLPRMLLAFNPRIVGVTVNNTVYVRAALRVLQEIKRILPEALVIVGGHHPTMVPEDFQVPDVDAIFFGWADTSFPAFVRAVDSGHNGTSIPGVLALQRGVPVNDRTSAARLCAADVPLPDRALTRRYRRHYRDELGRRTYLVNTVRGCPNRCTFCACWRAAGGRVLVRTAEDVARELSTLPKGHRRVFFADDHTFSDLPRAAELCHLIRRENAGRLYAGYTRTDTVVKHPELFEAWRKAGLRYITIGVEAANDGFLSRLGKGTSSKGNEEAIRILHRLDIIPFAHLLVDPDFGEEDFDALSDFVRKVNLSHPIFVVLTPLPGTVLFEEKHSQINMPYEYFDFVHAIVPTRLGLQRFSDRYLELFFEAYSLRRNLIQKLERVGMLPAPNNLPQELPRSVPLLTLAGWQIMGRPLARKLRQHYGLDGRPSPITTGKICAPG